MKERNTMNPSATSTLTTTSNQTTTTNDTQSYLNPYNSNNYMSPSPGAIVKVTTCLDNQIQGKVLAYDQQTKFIVLRSQNANKQGLFDISFLNMNWCNKFELIEEPHEPLESLVKLNFKKLHRRVAINTENKYKEINSLGNEVSSLAQHLYYRILKTLTEVKWDDKKIIVMDSVIIDPPYEVTSCRSRKTGDNTQALEHVKKIVNKFNEEFKQQQLELQQSPEQQLDTTNATSTLKDDNKSTTTTTNTNSNVKNVPQSTSSILSPPSSSSNSSTSSINDK